MTLTSEPHLESVGLNQNIGQRSSSSNVRAHKQSYGHTHRTDCYTWTTKVIGITTTGFLANLVACREAQELRCQTPTRHALLGSGRPPKTVLLTQSRSSLSICRSRS